MNRVGIVVLVVVAGCGSSPPPPNCRTVGEACTATTDCCGNYVCTNGTCTTAVTCRSSGEACAATADCCSPFVCAGGKCGTAPSCANVGQACGGATACCAGYICSNGTCAKPTPPPQCSPANCATGCCDVNGLCRLGIVAAACGVGGGACSVCLANQQCVMQHCQTGATCRGQNQACAGTQDCCNPLVCYGGRCVANEMTWSMTASHDVTIDIEFWDETNGLAWPGNGMVYVQNDGTTVDYPLSCTLGHKVCFGAEDEGGNVYWGVGVSNQYMCNTCCFNCDGQTHPETLN